MDTKKLEQWYIKHHIKFPFRETKDPYKIWVSEIMLQQTQLETVVPYFVRFIKQYPDVKALHEADDEALKKMVEGIGYYRRFKLMKQAATVIVNNYHGVFPNTYEDVLSLPGVGLYTAGAIMSIAYQKPYGAVDGNVIRILSRQYNIQEDMRLEKNKAIIRNKNQILIEHTNPSDYTQALMDLGRNVCKPKRPLCDQCPIAESCQAYDLGIVGQVPFLSKIVKSKEIPYIVLMIRTKEGVILRKRTESLLEGMYEYPQFEGESISYVIDLLGDENIFIDVIDGPIEVKHIFTHQKWIMQVYDCELMGSGMRDDWQVFSGNELNDLPMAIAHRKIQKVYK